MSSFNKPSAPPLTSFSDLNDPIGKPKQSDESNPSSKVIAGAAAVGATVGMLVSGPAVALVAGAGAGIASMTSGTTGNVARSAGQLGVSVGSKAQELGKSFEEWSASHQFRAFRWSFVLVHSPPTSYLLHSVILTSNIHLRTSINPRIRYALRRQQTSHRRQNEEGRVDGLQQG